MDEKHIGIEDVMSNMVEGEDMSNMVEGEDESQKKGGGFFGGLGGMGDMMQDLETVKKVLRIFIMLEIQKMVDDYGGKDKVPEKQLKRMKTIKKEINNL